MSCTGWVSVRSARPIERGRYRTAGTGTGEAPPPGAEAAPPLPHDLFEATERLNASRAARDIFGDVFIDHFVKSRRAEDIALRRQVSAAERARYIEAV